MHGGRAGLTQGPWKLLWASRMVAAGLLSCQEAPLQALSMVHGCQVGDWWRVDLQQRQIGAADV